jgi:DNA-binding GntR family transcriptional regulator
MSDVITTESNAKAVNPDGSDVFRAYTALRKLILRCELRPGEQVSHVELGRRLGFGRTPLREAIRMLQQEGLMDVEKNQRPRVSPIDALQLDALYSTRILTDCLSLQLSVDLLTEENIRMTTEAYDETVEHSGPSDAESFHVAHMRFHQSMLEPAGKALVEQHRRAAEQADRVRRLYLVAIPDAYATAANEHAAILQAIVERNTDAAVTALATHLARTALKLMAHFAPEFDPRATRESLLLVTRGRRHFD